MEVHNDPTLKQDITFGLQVQVSYFSQGESSSWNFDGCDWRTHWMPYVSIGLGMENGEIVQSKLFGKPPM